MRRQIHIVPLGWEFDRVILPIRSMKAHRVYILCRPSTDPRRRHFLDKFVLALGRDHVQVIHEDVDSNLDTLGIMRVTSQIIAKEVAAGNHVSLNISGAGKVAAVAVALAAMAHLPSSAGELYYPVAKGYSRSELDRMKHGLAKGMDGDPITLPHFEIRLPPHPADWILRELSVARSMTLTYEAMITKCRGWKVQGFSVPSGDRHAMRVIKNRNNVQFNRRVVQKLCADDLVKIVTEGRNRSLVLLEPGKYVASLCSAPGWPGDQLASTLEE
jgi:hypothetical protein